MPRKAEPLPDAPLLANEWLNTYVHTSNLPDWLIPQTLPEIRWKDATPAPRESILALATSKKASDKETYQTLVDRLDASSLTTLAWPLFRRWMEAGFPSRHRWIMDFLADHGDELAMLQLGELARRWPNQGKIARSKQAILLFERNASLSALAQLDDLANSARQPSLRDAARDALQDAAHAKGLSLDDMLDQITPTAGLNELGQITFEDGTRSFVASLRPDFSLLLKNDAGKIIRSLPKPSAKDDANKWARASEILKVTKKQIKDLSQRLAKRMELSMIQERVWPIDRWRSTVLAHPILRFVAQRVIWTSIHPSATEETLFRVCEDLTFADDSDRERTLPSDATIAVGHPLFWGETSKDKWRNIIADYNIEPAFPQATRECFPVPPASEHQSSIDTYQGVRLDARRLALLARRDGWTAAVPKGAGISYAFFRTFHSREVTALLFHSGIFTGGYGTDSEVTIENLVFIGSVRTKLDAANEDPAHWLPIANVPPVIFSETIRDIHRIAAHAIED